MTTATKEPKTPTTDALLADIQKTRADIQRAYDAMLDPRDTPGSWTQRQKDTYEERRYRLPQHLSVCNTLTEQLTTAIATRARCVPARDRLLAAKAAIEQLITDAPDPERITDARAQQEEYNRQRWLAESLPAIQRGVGIWPNTGQPMLPIPLRAELTETCRHCGHTELKWLGPLPGLEEEIAEADRVITLTPGRLAALRAEVQPYLAETVSV